MEAIFTGLLYTIHVICCIVLIAVVLMHESKGDSLASVFGGGGVDSAFGVQFGKKINRFTVIVAVVFMGLSVGLGIYEHYAGRDTSITSNAPTPGVTTPPPGTGGAATAPSNTGGATTETPPPSTGSAGASKNTGGSRPAPEPKPEPKPTE